MKLKLFTFHMPFNNNNYNNNNLGGIATVGQLKRNFHEIGMNGNVVIKLISKGGRMNERAIGKWEGERKVESERDGKRERREREREV